MNLERVPLILLIAICIVVVYSFGALISYSMAGDNPMQASVNENMPGSSSDIFARRYHTQHASHSGLGGDGGPLSYNSKGP